MYQHILVAVEHSAADQTILAHVQPLARLTQARLLLLLPVLLAVRWPKLPRRR